MIGWFSFKSANWLDVHIISETRPFLHYPNAVTRLQKMRRERMSECMRSCVLGNLRKDDCIAECLLHDAHVHMVSPLVSSSSVLPPILLGKDPLPLPLAGRIRILRRLDTVQDVVHFCLRKHNGQSLGATRPDDTPKTPQMLHQHIAIQEQEGGKSLILRGSAYRFLER